MPTWTDLQCYAAAPHTLIDWRYRAATSECLRSELGGIESARPVIDYSGVGGVSDLELVLARLIRQMAAERLASVV
jgi:hypothetical protein